MSQIVEVLKRDNPMVKDFVMACEQWSEEGVQDGRLIISAKERPVGEHERRYNLQVGFFSPCQIKTNTPGILNYICLGVKKNIYQLELFHPSHRSAPTK